MKNFIRHIILFYCILNSFSLSGQNPFFYGLSFKAYEAEKEERTSLNLTSEGPFAFPDGFILEFNVQLRQAQYNFGYIFRIIGQNNEHIDLLLTHKNSVMASSQITAIYKSKEILCNNTLEELAVDYNEWIPIKLIANRKDKEFRIIINGKEFAKTDDYLGGFDAVDIVFGKNNNIMYQTSDVPAMSIKDITINNLKENTLYSWKLSQHTPDGVYDEVKGRFSLCENPHWLMDEHCFWKQVSTFHTGVFPQMAFNTKNNNVAIADKQSLYCFNTTNNSLQKEDYVHGLPLGSKSNQILYNTLDNTLFSYDFTNKTAFYNPRNKSWTNNELPVIDPAYWHHNRYFSPRDTTLYTFGGYGFHIYRNDINKYHFPTHTWQKSYYQEGYDNVSPRYLSGLGVIDDETLLLFGGYGNETGNQELSPRNYYDLYTYNTKTSVATKIWELDQSKHNFVVANSLVVDTLENCFYALCFRHQKFNTHMQLYRFSLTEPVYEIMADSIPFRFNDNHSYADLYLTNDKEKLVAVTSFTDEKGEKATISMYTLAFPPLAKSELLQTIPAEKSSYWVLILCAMVVIVVLVFLSKRKPKKTKVVAPTLRPIEQPNVEEESYDPIVGIKPVNNTNRERSILLFGGFQVIDSQGEKITREFTPLLKQLFLIILLNTLKEGKGISSFKLKETLWFDKSEEKAKNGLAQKTYSSFIKEYQSLFGAEYKLSFEQVIA